MEGEEQRGTKRMRQSVDEDMDSETGSEDLSQLCTQDEKEAAKTSNLPILVCEYSGHVVLCTGVFLLYMCVCLIKC